MVTSTSYREGPTSTFTHFGTEYRVDDLIALAVGKPDEALRVSDLDWIFAYSKPNQKRVNNASLEHPIIVIEDLVNGEMRYVVLDGLHRLAKLKLERRTYAVCRVVTEAELESLSAIK